MATKPWRRPRPKGPRIVLTAESKELARRRAEAAGRRYPNLVDNMYAAKLQRSK
jgi:ribosomal protein L15E